MRTLFNVDKTPMKTPQSPHDTSPQPPVAEPSHPLPSHSRGRVLGRPVRWVVFVMLLLIGLGLVNRFGLFGQKPRATVAGPPTVAYIVAHHSKPETEMVLPGTLEPERETALYAQATGYVKEWLVDIGADVHQGQLLLVIDSPEVDQNLAHAQAALAAAKANLQIALVTLKRSRELLARQFLSQQTVDDQEALMQARAADVHASEADVRRYQELQSFEHIVAPFSGRITQRNVEKGQLVNPNTADPKGWLYHLAALDRLRLYVNVPQNQARYVHPSMPVAVTLTEFPKRSFEGRVYLTAGALDAQSKTMLTEILIPNAGHELASGSYVESHFPLKIDDPAIIVPSNVLIIRADGSKVAILDEQGLVHLKPVATGRDFGTTLEILSGLRDGDKVITNPSDAIGEGARVSPQLAKD